MGAYSRLGAYLLFLPLGWALIRINTVYSSQYGFRQAHSTQHAILDMVKTIQTNMDKKLFSCGLFIELKKAFDTVNHTILTEKLKIIMASVELSINGFPLIYQNAHKLLKVALIYLVN